MNMNLIDEAGAAAPEKPYFFSDWGWPSWTLCILCLLLFAFLLYLIIGFLVRTIRLRRMVGTMREDLLLRRELADMAGGKDLKSQRREQYLRTESIRMDVRAAASRMQENGISPRRTGCWLLLGEPGSGKSRLMQQGEVELPAGINQATMADEATATLNLWITSKGAVWDIGGRMFLSRWGGRQDNEWRVFLEEFRKVYENSLPNGMVLTIPVDALLHDDAALQDRKISLIADEMRAMVHATGAYCPVWVVVTKCDLIPGFSEFGSLLDQNECRRSLGWYNPEPSGAFEQNRAAAAFDDLTARLRGLRDSFALNTTVWERTADGTDRADTMSPVYLMPERFAEMKNSLQRYLAGIFTHVQHREGHHGRLFRFCGFWFTAALDKPVVSVEHILVENREGSLRPVVIQQAPGVSSEMPAWQNAGNTTGIVTVREKILSTASPRHYFTADLWNKVIINSTAGSDYTLSAVRRLRRPYWAASLGLLALTLPLSVWVWLSYPDLQTLAQRDVSFWKSVQGLFRAGHIGNAPILVAEEGAQLPMTAQPVPTTNYTRREYLYSLNNMATAPAAVPFFWHPAAWLTDGDFSRDLLGERKRFIDKAALVNMLLKPAVDTSREVLSYRADHDAALRSDWTRKETATLMTLLQITRYGIDLMDERDDVKDDIVYANLVNLPNAPAQDSAIKSLWLSSYAANKSLSRMSSLNGYLRPVSMEAAQAISKGVALYSSEVRKLEVYPQLQYGVLRRFVSSLRRMRQLNDEMDQLERDVAAGASDDRSVDILSIIDRWKERFIELRSVRDSLIADAALLKVDTGSSLRSVADALKSSLCSELIADQNHFNNLTIGIKDSDNARFLRGQIRAMHAAVSEVLPRLTGNELGLTDELCAFWDAPADAPNEPRPWQKNYQYAETLYSIFNVDIPVGTRQESFRSRIHRVEERRRLLDVSLETLAKNNPDMDISVKDVVWNRMMYSVVNRWLTEAPQNNTELVQSMNMQLPVRKLPDIPYTQAGKVNILTCYEPENASAALEDMKALTEYAEKMLPSFLPEQAGELEGKLRVVQDAAEHYRTDYTLYWTEEVPALYRLSGIRTWAQFVESGEIFCTFDLADHIAEVNHLLLQALGIPFFSDEEKYPELSVLRHDLQEAQTALNPEKRRGFGCAAEFFSNLDTEPRKAWQTLLEMPVEDYLTTWWGTWYMEKSAVGLMLWNEYLTKGMSLLKRETASVMQADAGQCLPMASLFPLNNTPNRDAGQILSSYDIEDLQEKLEGSMPTDAAKRKEAEAKFAEKFGISADMVALRLPFKRKREKAWQDVTKVIDLIADPEQPLTCVPLLPASEIRGAAFSGEDTVQRVVPAGRRYPYVRVLCKGRALTQRINLNRVNEKDAELSAPLPADVSDLEFEFYRHSTSTTPDSTLKLSGAWSPLNLYLRRGSRLGDDKKTAYVPLMFRDKEGYNCLFWAGLRFNREMLPADAWPGASVFELSGTDPEDERKQKEKQLRKAIRNTFLTRHNVAHEPTAEDRAKLREEIENLQQNGYSISFEIVVPGMVTGEDDDYTRTAGRYPYFSLGTDVESSGKLRAMPETAKTAAYRAPGDADAVLRLFRHAEDEYSALYARTEGSLLQHVVQHASGYSATEGFFTVPFVVGNGSERMTYTLRLRPVLSPLYDDGLLPPEDYMPLTDDTPSDPITD